MKATLFSFTSRLIIINKLKKSKLLYILSANSRGSKSENLKWLEMNVLWSFVCNSDAELNPVLPCEEYTWLQYKMLQLLF